MKIKHYYEPIFGINCWFVYDYVGKEQDALKKLKRANAISKTETWEGLGFRGNENGKTVEYSKDNTIRYILFLQTRQYPTLVHEVIHLVNLAFSWKGIKLDFNNDEYYAYYVAWWYSQLEVILNKK